MSVWMTLRPVHWIGSAKRDFCALPPEVQDIMGFALHMAQGGTMHLNAKPLKGFGGAGVVEIVDDHQGNTYRAIYTVRYENAIYVLHAFQKKAKSGIATPSSDVELVKKRLKQAEADYQLWLMSSKTGKSV